MIQCSSPNAFRAIRIAFHSCDSILIHNLSQDYSYDSYHRLDVNKYANQRISQIEKKKYFEERLYSRLLALRAIKPHIRYPLSAHGRMTHFVPSFPSLLSSTRLFVLSVRAYTNHYSMRTGGQITCLVTTSGFKRQTTYRRIHIV